VLALNFLASLAGKKDRPNFAIDGAKCAPSLSKIWLLLLNLDPPRSCQPARPHILNPESAPERKEAMTHNTIYLPSEH
jgi:hypothetical protein